MSSKKQFLYRVHRNNEMDIEFIKADNRKNAIKSYLELLDEDWIDYIHSIQIKKICSTEEIKEQYE